MTADKRRPIVRVRMPLAVLGAVVAIAAGGCLGGGGAVQSPAQPGGQTAQTPAPPAGQTAQVVITGAVNKTYTPSEVDAVKIGDRVGISLYEDFPCGVDIQFPLDSPPGTYAFDNMRVEMVPKVWARYGELGACETDGGFFGYESVGGTLVLTASGTSFSGTFEFDAVDAKDTTKKIHVSGAFQNAALP
jgi:hypothetical protein